MKIGFLGCGKMGSALLEGILAAGVCRPEDVMVYDPTVAASEAVAARTGVRVAGSNSEVAAGADIILLCVKPVLAPEVAAACAAELTDKLLVSIAAGVSVETLQQATGETCRVVRVMPNTAVLVGHGASAYAAGDSVSDADRAVVERIFTATGRVWAVDENLLDAVTGLSGSGPAYLYLIIEAMTEGGVRMGLSRDLAGDLAVQTVAGAAAMVAGTTQSPAELRAMVTSPGGTTVAGLAALERAGVREALMDAVAAAARRAREMGEPS